MNYCPTCGTAMDHIAAAPAPVSTHPERKYVKIYAPDAFRNLCNLILTSPNCTDEKFIGALQDFPVAVHKYGQLTEGQAKFFKVIHKTVLGTWPIDLDKLIEIPEEARPLPGDLDGIPF